MKKKRDKKYRPRPIGNGGGLVAIANIGARGISASPLDSGQQTDLGAARWLALDNLARGSADEENWSCVVCALNIGVALSETVVGCEHEADFVRALEGLFRAKVRSKMSGNFRLDGEGLRDVKFALACHDEQVKLVTKREMVAAMDLVRKRIDEGNVYEEAAM